MKHAELAKSNFLPDKVNVELDVLGSSMVDGIPGHVDRRDIVTVDDGGLPDAMVELAKKMSQLGALGDCIGDPAILSLRTGTRDRVFWRLEDQDTSASPSCEL